MSIQLRPSLTMTGTRIQTLDTTHLCRRCGITITWDRQHRYASVCRDCTEYIPVTRKKI